MGSRRRQARGQGQGRRIPWIPIIGALVGIGEAFAIKFLFDVPEPIYGYIVALITVVIALQIDQITRTQDAVEKSREEAVLLERIDKVPWLRRLIDELVESGATIHAMPNNEIFVRRAKAKLQEINDINRRLARGRIYASPEEYCQIIPPAVSKASKIRGVAVSNPISGVKWWDTPQGRGYWKRNIEVLKRHGRGSVERIFLYQAEQNGALPADFRQHQNGALPADLRQLAASQAEAGVAVFTAELSQIPSLMRVDLAIFDEDFLYELQLNASGEPVRYFCSTNPDDVGVRRDHFDMIKALATPYGPPSDGGSAEKAPLPIDPPPPAPAPSKVSVRAARDHRRSRLPELGEDGAPKNAPSGRFVDNAREDGF